MLKLTFDVTNGALVPWMGSASQLPDFRQGRTAVEIRFVTPNPDAIVGSVNSQFAQYVAASETGFAGCRLGLWDGTNFTDGSSGDGLFALATELTLNTTDAEDPFWEGDFDLQTTEIAALTGQSASVYFTVTRVNTDLSLTAVYDQRGSTNAVIYSATDDGFASLSSAASARIPVKLPLRMLDEASGEIYEITRVSAGVVQFVWANPP